MSFTALSALKSKQLTEKLIGQSVIVDPASAKGRLLKAAATLFKRQGFDSTTVRDLAKEMGIKSGSLFHHYQSKQEILLNVMHQAILLNQARLELALSLNENLTDKIHALILCELQASLLDTGAQMTILVYEWRCLNPENQQKLLTLRDNYEAVWFKHLSQAKTQGLVNIAPKILRRFLIGSISGTIHWYQEGGKYSTEQLAEMMLTMALKDA